MIPFYFLALFSFNPVHAVIADSTGTPIEPSAFLDKLQNTATCAGCHNLLLDLKTSALLGDGFFVRALTSVCKLSRLQDDDVCEGAVAAEGPILAHDLREMKIFSHTSTLFCTSFLGLCEYPEVREHNVDFPKPKPKIFRPGPSGKEPVQFVHFSDIHVDHQYVVGSNYNCTKPICCRPYNDADAPGETVYPAGPYGDHRCDTPKALETAFYDAINKTASDALFAIFTGDVPEHAVWELNRERVASSIDDAYQSMALRLPVPIYGTVGNHESAPVNSFPHAGLEKDVISSQWVYDAVFSAWKRWIGVDAAFAKQYGAYSHRVPDSALRIISIDTNFYYKLNPWMYERDMVLDPNGQLAWLVEELQKAEDAAERVYIIGHMPFGVDDALHDGSNYLNQIVNRYDATIAAMFFGHTHKDHFQLGYSNYSDQSHLTANMVSYVAPSLTPMSGSPAFQILTADPETWAILDITTFATSLESPEFQTDGPSFKKYYSAREAYAAFVGALDPMAELGPSFWHNLTTTFEHNDGLFQEFYERKTRGWNVSPCTAECKVSEITQLRAAEAQYNGITPTRRRFLARQETPVEVYERREDDECDGSVLASVFRTLVDSSAFLPAQSLRHTQEVLGLP